MKALYCIPNLNQISSYLDFSEKYNAGFEYNDFFLPGVLDDEEHTSQIIASYSSLNRDCSEDTLHGAFLDICVHSCDPLIFKASDWRIHQSMNIAARLGVKKVIFHTNHIPNFKLQSYLDSWIDSNEEYWRGLLQEYPDMEVYIENMFDLDSSLICQLAERMADQPRFGVCLDIAHAFISDESVENWCKSLLPYVRHVHINDNNGIEDSHSVVGSASMPWSVYRKFMEGFSLDAKPSVLIEVRGYEDLEKSVEYMTQNHLYPFTK